LDGFKQRIIGALIIVSLAVIFLPMMFDEPHEERTRQTIDIPEQPDFPEVRVDRPQRPDADLDMEPVEPPEAPREPAPQPTEPQPVEPETQTRAEAEPEPAPEPASETPDSAALEGSYLVQLGSFGSGDNARKLRDRAREAGIQAYVEELTREGETFTRVFAGPFMSRSDAQSAKSDLDERFSLDTLVISAGKED